MKSKKLNDYNFEKKKNYKIINILLIIDFCMLLLNEEIIYNSNIIKSCHEILRMNEFIIKEFFCS